MLHTLGPRHSRFGPLNRLLRTDRFVPGLLVVGAIVGAWASCARPAEAADASGPLQVATTTLEAREVYRVDRVYGGEVRARRSSTLGFRHSGVLRIVHVDEGDSVDAGTLLAELDPEPFQAALDQASAGVARAEAGLAEARAAAELATATDRRFGDLRERGHASAQAHDEARLDLAARRARVGVAEAELQQARANLRAASTDLDRSRITAPYTGRVQGRFADEGSILVPGQQVLRLVESGVAEARIGLPTDVAAGLEPGTRHRFRAGSREVKGRLLHVLPEVDGRTRTITALFRLDEAGPPAGSIIELHLSRSVAADGFWVPITALAEAQRGLWSVYVVRARDDETIAERRIVEVIHTTADRVYVQGTLRDGERVVTTGTQRLVPDQPVAVADDDSGRVARR
jgi:RND family efflux transporter MFP subunit